MQSSELNLFTLSIITPESFHWKGMQREIKRDLEFPNVKWLLKMNPIVFYLSL